MMRGCDLSHWNSAKQFNHVFKYADFFIHKATESVGYIDPECFKRIEKCIKNGKLTGLYHFWQNSNPLKQLNNFNKIYSRLCDYSIAVLDVENKNTNWHFVEDFCTLFTNLYHKPIIIYTDDAHYKKMPESLKKYPLWIARYNSKMTDKDIKRIYKNVIMWQYTNKGAFAGESFGNLDCDYYFGTIDEWEALLRGEN